MNIWKGMFGIMAMIAMVAMVSCEKEPEEETPTGPTGIYIKGTGIALTDIRDEGKLNPAKNEVNQEVRGALREIYVAVKAGSEGFHIVNVVKGEETSWGPGSDFAQVQEADLDGDEPRKGLWRGTYEESTTPFTVPEDGLYHVALDTELGIVVVARVEWGLIGGATPGGWSTDTEMMATFDLNSMVFSVEDLVMGADEYKFRYSGGWKIILDDSYSAGDVTGIKVNTNFGGTLSALEAGGDNMTNDERAKYTITLTWSLTDGYSATMEKTGEADEEPEYPESLYMIGGALNLEDSDANGTPDGWQWELTDVPMIPVHSHPNAFWRIVWLEASEGLKFAPAREWNGDFGSADDTQPGVGDHKKGGSNIPAPAEAGYYMVYVDLDRDSISVTQPDVYVIGDALGSWDTADPNGKFTVDNENEVVAFTGNLSAAELRMHVWHKWPANTSGYEWWQHEFIILSDVIEYRGGGGDQERVTLTGGETTIELNFRTGAGSIAP